jgi:hypothetical protein
MDESGRLRIMRFRAEFTPDRRRGLVDAVDVAVTTFKTAGRASLAMSTDGSFPSRPRQYPFSQIGPSNPLGVAIQKKIYPKVKQ